MAVNDKIQLIHPEGKNAPRISLKTYEIFKNAILTALEDGTVLTFTELADAVEEYIDVNKIEFSGSADWFTISVKHHLESEGRIETLVEKGRKMTRLKVK